MSKQEYRVVLNRLPVSQQRELLRLLERRQDQRCGGGYRVLRKRAPY